MIYKIEESDIDGFDFRLNETIYFSVVGDNEDGIILDYYCKYLTNTEIKEILEFFINDTLKNIIKSKLNENKI